MTSQDIIDTLQPELDQLVAAFDVEPDERQAVAEAALALFAACRRMLDEHDLDWPPDAAMFLQYLPSSQTPKKPIEISAIDDASVMLVPRPHHA